MKRFLAIMSAAMLASVGVVHAQSVVPDPDDPYVIEVSPETESTQDERISHLPLAFGGLSGLLVTASTRTVEYLHFAGGIAGEYRFNEDNPGFSIVTGAVNLAFGFPKRCELAVHVPYIIQEFDVPVEVNQPTTPIRQGRAEGLGDIDVWLKYAILHRIHYLPSLALGVAFIAPSGDFPELAGSVYNYGFRLMFAASVELNDFDFTDYALGAFFEGQLVFRDLFDGDHEEKSGLINLGMLFPLDNRNYVSLLAEYNGAFHQGWLNDQDTHGFTGGFRFTMKWFGVTLGYSYVVQRASDWDDSHRAIATVGGRI